MQSKNALSNLKNRYIAVLKKCNLINTFGSLALATFLATPALTHAALVNPSGTTIPFLDASNEVPDAKNTISATNNGNIDEGKFYRDKYGNEAVSGLFVYTVDARNIFLNNYGDITVSSDQARVHAMDAYTENGGNFQLFNIGTLTVSSKNQDAYAMSAYSFGEGNHTLINKGTIKVNSEDVLGGQNARAFGMSAFSNDDGSHKLENNNSIEVTAVGHNGFGMYARTQKNGSHELANYGNIKVDVVADSSNTRARGMAAESYLDGDHTITNKGDINVTLNGSTYGKTYATGIYAESWHGVMNITNDGNIVAKNYTDYGYAQGIAIDTETSGNHTITNNKYIEVHSEESYSNGIYLEVWGEHTVVNNGTIKASSKNGAATGITVVSANKHNTNNTGTIMVESKLDATGINFNTISPDSIVNNTGIIKVKSLNGNAFEVFGYDTYSVGTYATTLREWNSDDAVFATNGGEVNFVDSTLILRPGTAKEGFKYDNEYEVTNMIVDTSLAGSSPTAITGKIKNAVAEVPFLIANLNDTDPTKPKVSLSTNVTGKTVSPAQLAKHSAGVIHSKVTKLANRKIKNMIKNRMAGSIQEVSEKAYEQGVIVAGDMLTFAPSYQDNMWAIYLDAYAGYAGNNEYDFGTHTKGMTLGGERAIGDKLNVGLAMDFSNSTTDGQDGLVADSTDITFAANADYFINPDWYVSGTMALSFGENDMDYMISPSLYAKDDYNSQAFYMALSTGYVFEINENNIIVPELGLSYLNMQSDDITVDFAASDMYDMHIANDSFSALYANLMVTWQGHFDIARGTLRPSFGLGIRQNLTGSDFDSNVQALGSSFDTVVTEDDTTFLTNVGLEWQNGNFSMAVSYSGGYGAEQSSHSGNVKFRYEF